MNKPDDVFDALKQNGYPAAGCQNQFDPGQMQAAMIQSLADQNSKHVQFKSPNSLESNHIISHVNTPGSDVWDNLKRAQQQPGTEKANMSLFHCCVLGC